jgi:hypothetical protein
MAENYKHFFLENTVKSEKYRPKAGGSDNRRFPSRNRETHSKKLIDKLNKIWEERKREGENRSAQQLSTKEGTYLTFTSDIDFDLKTESLEDRRKGIRLLNVKEEELEDHQRITRATVFIPNGSEGHFIKKITDYQEKQNEKGVPRNAKLINSIEDISFELLESLWTDPIEHIPQTLSKWCEVWLNVDSEENREYEQIQEFKSLLNTLNINHKENFILFPERVVMLIEANKSNLVELIKQSDYLAEFRIGQEPAGFWTSQNSTEQEQWVDNLLNRINVENSNVSVCILDSGVNNGHPLLSPILPDENMLTPNPEWGTFDHHNGTGHGTLMAGVAGYGNFESVLESNGEINLTHNLISVKLLPPSLKENESDNPELWGDITSQCISRAEINNSENSIIFCMPVTSIQGTDKGKPSSWSGAIDNLTFGNGENPKLIIISAGNLGDNYKSYPQINFKTPIENPAQSWNALTVGAYTEKYNVKDQDYKDYKLIASRDELSPYSTTSLTWSEKWPIKPDIVFEGGNRLIDANGYETGHEDLEMLSTSKIIYKPFSTIWATSGATAQASFFAAKIQHQYPEAWPETIRALMVHSAQWKDAMINQMEVDFSRKVTVQKLLKVFGYGVPNLSKAMYSQESAFTFIIQEHIQPFSYNDDGRPVTNEIHFFELPWPKDLLLDLSDLEVKFKITLSFFIEPGAGEIGWKNKYRYQSYGLNFDINNIDEPLDDFRKRVNVAAREEDESVNGRSGSERWMIGTNGRKHGSIHTDIWEGTAAELSQCNLIAIYPIIGWWRERKHLNQVENKARYSLVISLETPKEDVMLYTTVKNMIEVPIEIDTDI